MVQVLQRKTPWGEVAGGFGKGLGESFSEEVGRHVTAKGIEKLSSQMSGDKTLTELQLVAGVDRIPGMTPEKAAYLIPILQRAQSRKAQELRSEGGGQPLEGSDQQVYTAPGERETVSDTTKVRETPSGVTATQKVTEKEAPTLVTQDAIDKARQSRPVWTQEKMDREINRALDEDRSRTVEQATQVAAQRELRSLQPFDAKVQLLEDQMARQESLRTKLDSESRRLLQRGGKEIEDINNEVPSTIYNSIENDLLLDSLNSNLTADQLAKKGAKKVLQAARDIKAFRDIPDRPFIGKASDHQLKLMEGYRKKYEKWGDLEGYKSEIMAKDYSEPFAASLAYPMSLDEKRDVARHIKKYPKKLDVSTDTRADPKRRIAENDKRTEELTSSLMKDFNGNSSLQTYSMVLYDLGLDVGKFYDTVRDMNERGEITLSDRQELELNKADPVKPTLNDVYSSIPGKGDYKPRFGFWENIKRFSGK